MTAMEFCLARDKERGEAWSNDYTWLAEGMEEYARLKTAELECELIYQKESNANNIAIWDYEMKELKARVKELEKEVVRYRSMYECLSNQNRRSEA